MTGLRDQARLETLEREVQALNNLREADVEVIAEIETMRLQVDLMARQVELRRQEDIWSRELGELLTS